MMFLYRLIFFTVAYASIIHGQEVVFIRPYQNMFSEKLSKYGTKDLEAHYNQYKSWSGFESKYDCMRATQVPLHTRGTVVAEDKETGELCIQLDSMTVDIGGKQQPCTFWTLSYYVDNDGKTKKPTLIMLNDEDRNHQRMKALPEKINFHDPATLHAKNNLVLMHPWVDAVNKQEYSAGTRWVRAPEKDTKDSYAVYFFDNDQNKLEIHMLPKTRARPCDEQLSDDERQALFNTLIQSWCCHKNHTITPYVWGGGVIMHPIADKGFVMVRDDFFAKPVQYYVREHAGEPAGVDCSALVLLAAQIAGIDYFYKTTTTLLKHGSALSAKNELLCGGIIVWAGHMIILVWEHDKLYCIESLGYGAGAGKVRKIVLEKRFKGINSMDDLWDAYLNKKELHALYYDSLEKVQKTVSDFKIVSLFNDQRKCKL